MCKIGLFVGKVLLYDFCFGFANHLDNILCGCFLDAFYTFELF